MNMNLGSFNLRLLMACLVFATFGLTQLAAQQGTRNLVPNPSFENPLEGGPASWTESRWGGEGLLSVDQIGRSGTRSLMISSAAGADISWSTTVEVQPHATYRLTGWIKTEEVQPVAQRRGRGALLNLHNMQGVATKAVTGTQDWTRVEVVFETGSNDAVQINCLFGGWGLATGKAWFDDVQLELLSAERLEPEPSPSMRPQKGHPISKYIYGQFIEHLGRCIYGGIWAEMLEDRKFYYPDHARLRSLRTAPRCERAAFPVVRARPGRSRVPTTR